MKTKTFCVHGARSTRVVGFRSVRQRAAWTRQTAVREGWAYATERSGPGVRVVTDAENADVTVGATHLDLDVYERLTDEKE